MINKLINGKQYDLKFEIKGKCALYLPLELKNKFNDDVINDPILRCVCVYAVSLEDQSFQNGESLKDSDN